MQDREIRLECAPKMVYRFTNQESSLACGVKKEIAGPKWSHLY